MAKAQSSNGAAAVDPETYAYDIVPPPGVGGYDQCWYPMARSADLKPGDIIGEDYFGGRVIIYRGKSGKAYVTSAYCRHVGASLCTGAVVGDDVRCMFHHWRFGPDGKCTHIPSGEPIPERAQLFVFPVEEALGMIWAFNGPEPLYDLPRLPVDESEVNLIPSEPRYEPVPHHMLISNSYDFQHLKWVHDLELADIPDNVAFDEFGAQYDAVLVDPKFGNMKQYHRLFGTNVFHLAGTFDNFSLTILCAMVALPEGKTKFWNISAAPKAESPEEQKAVDDLCNAGNAFAAKLAKDDYPITNAIRFAEDVLVESDSSIRNWVEYLRGFPRFQPPVT